MPVAAAPNHKRGFLSQITSRLGVTGISIISTAILARLLLPGEFGLLAIAVAVIALAEAIFDGAFAINIVHRTDLDAVYVSTTFSLSVIFAAILGMLLYLGADAWETALDIAGLGVVLRFLSVTLVIKAIGMVSRNLLLRQHRLHALSISAFVSAFVGSLIVSCGLAAAGAGIWSLLWGNLAAVGIEMAMNLLQARPNLSLRISGTAAREVLGTGSVYTISQLLNWCMTSGTGMIAARALGAADFGFYSRAGKLLEQATGVIGQPLMRVFFPTFARMREDRAAAGQMLVRALSLSAWVFAIASALLAVHSKLIVQILLGSRWQATASAVQILMLSLLPRCCYKITESAAFGLGAASLAVKRQAIFAGVALAAAAIGSHWHIDGVAIAVAVSIWINYLVSLGIAARLVRMPLLRIVMAHLPPIGLACCVGVLDHIVIAGSHPLGEWAAQIIGAITGCIVAALFLIVAPARLLPSDIVARRRAWIAKAVR